MYNPLKGRGFVMSLSPREVEVLSIIVESYIKTSSPIGSRYVAKKSKLNLSPASMRNIMADLTEKGYLTQPHTSAGRIPTEKGFKFYISQILKPKLPQKTKHKIKKFLFEVSVSSDIADLLESTSKLISSQASQVGMVISPGIDNIRWKYIDFVLVKPGLVLVVMVFEGGMVQNKVLNVDKKITSEELIKYKNFLNDRFKGQTITEIKKKIIEEMEEAHTRFNELYYKALSLANRAFVNVKPEREIYLDGTLTVFEQIDKKDIESMKELLEFLEQRSKLLKLLDKISSSKDVIITFGGDLDKEKLKEWSIISSPYKVKGETLGLVGTIGPINMDYSSIIPLVDYVAKMLSEILEMRF